MHGGKAQADASCSEHLLTQKLPHAVLCTGHQKHTGKTVHSNTKSLSPHPPAIPHQSLNGPKPSRWTRCSLGDGREVPEQCGCLRAMQCAAQFQRLQNKPSMSEDTPFAHCQIQQASVPWPWNLSTCPGSRLGRPGTRVLSPPGRSSGSGRLGTGAGLVGSLWFGKHSGLGGGSISDNSGGSKALCLGLRHTRML